MKIEHVKEIANAVLYEGYLLYPYRHSAIKNRQRWNFGVVYPREYSEAGGSIEPWTMQTECLLMAQEQTSLDIYVRFLHLLLRTASSGNERPEDAGACANGSKRPWTPQEWEEGIEREMSIRDLSPADLAQHPRLVEINFPGGRMIEPSTPSAAIVREQQPLMGMILLMAERISANLYKLSIRIENRTPVIDQAAERRDAIMLQSFVSTHTILQVHRGAFVSLLDPPDELQNAVRSCQNIRTWPVLVGHEGEHDAMLSSPIILYDYPQSAPESAGALFDGTEIDEILTLRIMTLTEEEKEEIRQGDERAREILERTEALSPEQMMQLHGTIRSRQPLQGGKTTEHHPGEDYPPPTSLLIAGKTVRAGSRVRLHPKARADAFDLLLAGKTARVEVIQQDYEDRLYLVVTLDDDPGREQWDERVLPGHRFFFFPEEVEPLEHTENAKEAL